MKLFGVTGGIGMGKSTSGDLLRKQGFPVVDTDEIAHRLVETGQPALREIVETFGSHLLDASGQLRRGELAKIVFPDPQARKQLENILHPRIRAAWHEEVRNWRRRNEKFGFVLIPLLFETKAESEFDAVICVACSEPSQRVRLQQRGWDDQQISQRIASQMPVQKKMELSNFVIWTETSVDNHASQLAYVLSRA